MTKHFAFSRWEAGLSPSLPRAQDEGGSDTHSLTVLCSVLFGLDHDALSFFCSRPEAEIGIARLVEEDG